MDNFTYLILGVALLSGGLVTYRGSRQVLARAAGAAATCVGSLMSLAALINLLSVSAG